VTVDNDGRLDNVVSAKQVKPSVEPPQRVELELVGEEAQGFRVEELAHHSRNDRKIAVQSLCYAPYLNSILKCSLLSRRCSQRSLRSTARLV